jgi:predicted GNAT family acetyltransferase
MTFTALLGAEAVLEPGATVEFALATEFEHAFLPDGGELGLGPEGTTVAPAHLAYLAPGRDRVRLENPSSARLRVLILGGPPFTEEITMWWNFVGRSHEEIVAFREAWNAQIGAPAAAVSPEAAHDGAPFGSVVGLTEGEAALPAPPLPNVRLRPRPRARGTRTTAERNEPMTVHESERQAAQAEFVHADQRHRYEVRLGGVTAGFTQYRVLEGGTVLAFDHTEVAEGYSGLGLAGKLVTFALDDVRANGQRIRPYCPYVRAFLKRHREYADLVEDGFTAPE